jgi:uncharacterized protein (TIGR02301 family)
MRRAALLAMVPGLALAAPAPPPRSAEARQRVAELAYALGETHALRQACLGEGDQAWRLRMDRLLAVEAAAPALGAAGQQRLIARFNAGFASASARFPVCGPEVQPALAATAVRGEALARRLGGPDR